MRKTGDDTRQRSLDAIVQFQVERQRDAEIVTKRYNTFFGTDLDRRIAEHAVDAVVRSNQHSCLRSGDGDRRLFSATSS